MPRAALGPGVPVPWCPQGCGILRVTLLALPRARLGPQSLENVLPHTAERAGMDSPHRSTPRAGQGRGEFISSLPFCPAFDQCINYEVVSLTESGGSASLQGPFHLIININFHASQHPACPRFWAEISLSQPVPLSTQHALCWDSLWEFQQGMLERGSVWGRGG